MTIQQAARDAHAAGMCPIPAGPGKAPAVKWRHYTAAGGSEPRPDLDQLDAWFADGRFDGFGVVCGAASGNLEFFEFEGRAVRENIPKNFTDLAAAAGLGDLWRRVVHGYLDQSPAGGLRTFARVDGGAARNTKLAARPARLDELDERERQVLADKPHTVFSRVLVETRGEGGFVVVPPSGGRTHSEIPDGLWKMIQGGFATIATITADERDALHQLAATLDQMPATAPAPAPAPAAVSHLFTQPAPAWDDDDSLSPGDDYNARTTWDDFLAPRGWTRLHTDSAGITYWSRPGKADGISATTGKDGLDNLYVFSTSTQFAAERPYDRFGALAHLEHGGDFSAAAKALQGQGYGRLRETRLRSVPGIDGNLAKVVELHRDQDADEQDGHGDTSDSVLVDQAADDVLRNRFRYVDGLGWLQWDGKRWAGREETSVIEVIRLYLADRFEAKTAQAGRNLNQGRLKELQTMLTAAKARNVTALARGVDGIHTEAADLDANPDLLNTPSGVVDLRTGQLGDHDPALLMTKMTHGSYRPGYRHPDWQKALEALPATESAWFQVRAGQAVTGHPNPDGILVLLQGGGENGKSLLTTDGLVPGLGDYADVASGKLLNAANEHSEEMADLRGKRFLIAEELTEDRALNVTAIKRIQDVGTIKARHVYKSYMTFQATHSLFATTNYRPVINETDHGTWRRLALLCFPYTFRKPGEELTHPNERHGDSGLKARIKRNSGGQHDAIVTWVVEGAMRWYAAPDTALAITKTIEADTRAWRMEADRILGFWDARLIPDSNACVLHTDLYEVFASWLAGNGHKAWAKETFHPRFADHTETSRHGIAEKRTRNPIMLGMRRPVGVIAPPPSQPWVYVGVRFRLDSDPVPE